MKSFFRIIILCFILSFSNGFQNHCFSQINIFLRTVKGNIDNEVFPTYPSWYINDHLITTFVPYANSAVTRNDFAFGVQVPIVKKWKLSIQAEMEMQKKEFQKQVVTSNVINLPNGGVEYQDVFEDIFFKVKYSATQFPILLKKEIKVIPKLNLSILAGMSIGYNMTNIDYITLYNQGKETTDYIRTTNGFQVLYYEMKNGITNELEYYDNNSSKKTFIAGLGVSYELFNFKLGIEYRYTTHNILVDHTQPYHSANFILGYNLFNTKNK
ncbi:hypothetical protein VB264_13415 [Arcicella aquatica]|uniref:Outer membrane protein beta-barrel domain-containing protein n=1 Tax=Arcicella aquatica TaxID=217141 RepID=A0ABU5QPY0_9BACT|nr:hypothetical protein [Arcicella aquatica]MEA5258789.1 hypothetical protein [Arcicella aquatica]